MNQISELISQMVSEKSITIRKSQRFSWGDNTECQNTFVAIFTQIDATITEYQHLPEYDEVVDWMTDTKGKGLLLMGDCGRGKSIIISGVIPVLLRIKCRSARAIHSQDMTRPSTNLDYLLKTQLPVIDEVGVENQANDYGEKSEGFNLVMNIAERYHRPLFLTTNLTAEQLLERYGERTMDRLQHLCRIVEFKGDSLRK